MTAGGLLALLVGAGVAAFIAAPLFRRDAVEAERVAAAVSEAAELEARREMLLAALRDLEDDRATAKIDDADYAELRARLSHQAVEVMKRLDAIDEQRKREAPPARPVGLPRDEQQRNTD